MKRQKSENLRGGLHKILKLGCLPLGLILLYQGLLFTLPAVSKQMETLAVFSAGLSFINGGVALVQQEIKDFEAESQIKVDSQTVSEGETNLQETSSSEESVSQKEQESTQTAASSQIESQEIPERIANSGDVVRKTLGAGASSQFVNLNPGYVKNLSQLSAQQVIDFAGKGLPFALEDTDAPQVLIYHTHATESYQPYACDWYDLAYNARNTDNSQNMVAVGNVLEEKLKQAGIGVIHDATQHDNPSYTGAYDRSRVTIEKYMKQYPSIKVVLDIHRDALQGENVITAPVTEINGKKTAQLMIISCADNGSGRIPNYTQNLTFACALQKQMESDYPTLTRPILLDDRFYNQDMSPGALLVEVGGHGNTLEEAENAISFFADSLIQVLK